MLIGSDVDIYQYYFEDDRHIPNKLMVHCVGENKQIIQCQSVNVLGKCVLIGEALSDGKLDPFEVERKDGGADGLILLSNNGLGADLVNARVYEMSDRDKCNERYDALKKRGNVAVYNLRTNEFEDMEPENDSDCFS